MTEQAVADTESESDEKMYTDLMEWALDDGYVIETKSGSYRVVETGYLGSKESVRGYIKGMIAARHIDNGTYPTWEHDDVPCRLTDTPNGVVRNQLVETMEERKR